MSYLLHYGMPRRSGRYPWGSGERPYQSSVRKVKSAAKTRNKVESIVGSLSKDEKLKLGMDPKDPQYLTIEEGEHVIHRTLKEIGDVPVAFFDLLDDGDSINLAFATRSGKEYRGKGYGTEVAKEAMKWLDKHPEARKDRDVVWGVKTDNKASIAVAEKLGFKIDEDSYNDGWVNYVKKGPVNKNKFNKEIKNINNNLNNKINNFKKEKLDIDAVKQRGNLTDAEASKASKLGNDVFDKASKAEPDITRDVVSVANKTGVKMYGLENRLKQPTSLSAKIGSDAKEKGIGFEQAAGNIKDSIRYTYVSPDSNFTKNYNQIKTELSKLGYEESTCKNYFQQYKDGKVKHKSVQSVFQDQNNNRFEVQFQTPGSQAAKELKLPIYNERRLAGNSPQRNDELEAEMDKLASFVNDPPDVYKIKGH